MNLPINLDRKIWQWLVLLLLAFIWGSSFILMKKGLIQYRHDTVAALRIFIASVFLSPMAIKNLKHLKVNFKYIVLTGFLGNGIPAFLFTFAQTKISSSMSGMLNSLTPIFALIIGLWLFKRKTKNNQIIGVVIGLIGALSLIFSEGVVIGYSNINYSLLVVLATICYALSVNIIKFKLKDLNAIAITSLAFLCIGPFSILYLLFFTPFFHEMIVTPDYNFRYLVYISILAIIGTAFSVILFNFLIKKVSTIFAASVTYLIPAFAILWGILDGETLNLIQFISICITLLGIYFINKS